MELDEAISQRHSVRNFQTKKPDWRNIVKAVDAGRKGPLAGNIPSIKFIIVDDDKKIKSLADAAQQSFVQKVSYIVVVCSDSEQLGRSYGDRAERYMRQQAGAAIENFLLKLTDLGLSTSWVGAFQDDAVRRVLKIPEKIEVEALFPIGYESGRHQQKKKPSMDQTMFFNEWGQEKMSPEYSPRD